MKLTRTHRYLLSLLSGILMTLSFPFTGSLTPLTFIAWVPLLLVEHDLYLSKAKMTKIFIYAFITLFLYNLGTTYWLLNTVGAKFGTSFIFIVNGTLMALSFMLYHWTKRYFGFIVGSLGFFIVWIGFEYLHYHWELSYPYLNLGNIFSIRPEWVQWYSFTGVLGGTLWILLVNFFTFKIVANRLFDKKSIKSQAKTIVAIALIVLIPSAISLMMYNNYEETKNPKEVIVTQPNIDTYTMKFKTDEEGLLKQLDLFIAQADSLMTENTAVVLSPETVISIPFYADQYANSNTFNHLQNKVNEWDNVSLVSGAGTFKFFPKRTRPSMKPVEGQSNFYELYDDLLLITKGQAPQFVHKSELVIGTEKIPFVKYFPFLEDFAYHTGDLTGSIGVEEEPRVLNTQGFTFAPIICYESIYGWRTAEQVRKRAEALFIITNDGWWKDSPGHKQHHALARLRALETRRYVARSANTGISSIINQRGDVVMSTKYDSYEALRGDIQLNKKLTLYAKHGDYIGKLAIFLLYILIGYAAIKGINALNNKGKVSQTAKKDKDKKKKKTK